MTRRPGAEIRDVQVEILSFLEREYWCETSDETQREKKKSTV